MSAIVLAVTNQKGGTAKTTTSIHLAQALAMGGSRVLLIDMDPQGNASQALGLDLAQLKLTIADLIWDRATVLEQAIVRREARGMAAGLGSLDLIPANTQLARIERGMVTVTNSEFRLAQRIRELRGLYDLVVIDCAPSFGPLLNSVLNAANHLIVPVDSNCFALMGVQKLLAEVEEIKAGMNPDLSIMGFLTTLSDRTVISAQISEALASTFGAQAFSTKIRRAVSIREAAMVGQTVFEYDPTCGASEDYLEFTQEVILRMQQQSAGRGMGELRLVEGGAQ